MCCYEHVAPYVRYNPKVLWFVALSETWISSWGNSSLSFHVIIRRQIVTERDWSVDSVCLLSLGIPITVTLFVNQTPSLFHVCLSVSSLGSVVYCWEILAYIFPKRKESGFCCLWLNQLKKVKQSRYRPGQALEGFQKVEASRFEDIRHMKV